jgi:2-methylcitrate dehydratase PrpD
MTTTPIYPNGPTGQLATWLATVTLDEVPAQVRQRAKYLLLDGIGCALVGAQLPWSRTAVEAVTGFEGSGASRVIGWGRTTSAPAAAVLNGTFIQGFELDDFHPFAPVHSASLVLPALLSTAEHLGRAPGSRFLLGAIAGFEVGPRVGLALHGPQMLNRGWHSGPVFGTHSAAAAAGVLRGLNGAQFEDALGLAATQSAGLMAAQFEAMSKRMHHGFAARNGFYAAGLAAAGYTGIKRVYEQPYGGFLSVFGEGHDPDPGQIAADLGQRWETERIMVKQFAAMGGLHSAIAAALRLRDRVTASAIDRIDVDVAETIYHHGWWDAARPLTAIGAQMHIGYSIAAALLDGQVLPAQFSGSRINADDIWTLMSRTTARLDKDLEADPMKRFSTRITITLKTGQRLEELVEQPPGGPASPTTNEQVAAKFHALTAEVMDASRAAQIELAVLGMEESDDLTELFDLLAAPVGSALEGKTHA